MTIEQKDAAWRALPEIVKKKAREEFRRHKSCNSSTGNNFCCGYVGALIHFFGKDNLTASEEEKPRFKVGDIVKLVNTPASDFNNCIGKVVFATRELVHIKFPECDKVVEYLADYVIPYTEEQEPKNGERVDFSSSSLKNRKNLTENDISSMSKEIAEFFAKVGYFIEKNQTSQINWLAYRMELAKEISPKLIVALSDGGLSLDSCLSVINKTAIIVDGIVERLKERSDE